MNIHLARVSEDAAISTICWPTKPSLFPMVRHWQLPRKGSDRSIQIEFYLPFPSGIPHDRSTFIPH
jgi:hypothetical protein